MRPIWQAPKPAVAPKRPPSPTSVNLMTNFSWVKPVEVSPPVWLEERKNVKRMVNVFNRTE